MAYARRRVRRRAGPITAASPASPAYRVGKGYTTLGGSRQNAAERLWGSVHVLCYYNIYTALTQHYKRKGSSRSSYEPTLVVCGFVCRYEPRIRTGGSNACTASEPRIRTSHPNLASEPRIRTSASEPTVSRIVVPLFQYSFSVLFRRFGMRRFRAGESGFGMRRGFARAERFHTLSGAISHAERSGFARPCRARRARVALALGLESMRDERGLGARGGEGQHA